MGFHQQLEPESGVPLLRPRDRVAHNDRSEFSVDFQCCGSAQRQCRPRRRELSLLITFSDLNLKATLCAGLFVWCGESTYGGLGESHNAGAHQISRWMITPTK